MHNVSAIVMHQQRTKQRVFYTNQLLNLDGMYIALNLDINHMFKRLKFSKGD